MSLDAAQTVLTQHGTVTIDEDGQVRIEGFEASEASCRDIAVLACLWAAQILIREANASVEQPGASRVSVD